MAEDWKKVRYRSHYPSKSMLAKLQAIKTGRTSEKDL